MRLHGSGENLPLLAANHYIESNRLTKMRMFCSDFFEKQCSLKGISKMGLISAIVSGIFTASIIAAGSFIQDNDLGYKLFAVAIGTMFLTACCLINVWLPCRDGECIGDPGEHYDVISGRVL